MAKFIKSTTDLIKEIKPTSVIAKILRRLPKDPLLRSYSQVYLGSLPDRILSLYSVDHLVVFIQNRYQFFINYIDYDRFHFELTKVVDDQLARDVFVLELTCPDAYFLLITLELMLQRYDARITKMYHPIFQINRKNGNVVNIQKSKAGVELRSSIYLEFDISVSDQGLISKLKNEISQKMSAIQYAQQDHHQMLQLLMDVKTLMHQHPSPVPHFHQEWIDLMDWLKDYNYSFFGYCRFDLKGKAKKTVSLDSESCLGILRDDFFAYDSNLLAVMKKHSQRFVGYRSPFIFDVIAYESPIQRFENLMRLSIKIPVSKTHIVEHNFIGLLKRSSLLVKNQDTPIIRLKMDMIIENKHLLPGSYDYNQIIRIFTYTPKFELFRTPTELLYQMVDNLLSITNPNDVHCFTRRELDVHRTFVMVVVPLSLFTSKNIQKIDSFLCAYIPHESYEFIEVKGIHLSWISFIFDQPNHPKYKLDIPDLESKIKAQIKPWEELLKLSLLTQFSVSDSNQLYKKYALMFPAHHRVRRTPQETVRDIVFLEQLHETKAPQFNLVPFVFSDSVLHNKASILFIYNLDKIDLIHCTQVILLFVPFIWNLLY